MQHARAFLFAAQEDFGIVPVEAQACGTPVIAYGKGGVTESVRGLETEHPTGVFFAEPTVESLIEAIELFEKNRQRISPLLSGKRLTFCARSLPGGIRRLRAPFAGGSGPDGSAQPVSFYSTRWAQPRVSGVGLAPMKRAAALDRFSHAALGMAWLDGRSRSSRPATPRRRSASPLALRHRYDGRSPVSFDLRRAPRLNELQSREASVSSPWALGGGAALLPVARRAGRSAAAAIGGFR